jgi:hypothetical protein
MELNKNYSLKEIESNGLVARDIRDINTKIFTNNDKVYFFESIDEAKLRLFSVINKRSFFL